MKKRFLVSVLAAVLAVLTLSGMALAARSDRLPTDLPADEAPVYDGPKWTGEISEIVVERSGYVFTPGWTVELSMASDEAMENTWLEMAIRLGDTCPLAVWFEYGNDVLRWTVDGSTDCAKAEGEDARSLVFNQEIVQEASTVPEFVAWINEVLAQPDDDMRGLGQRLNERDYRALVEEDGFKVRFRLKWERAEELEKPFSLASMLCQEYLPEWGPWSPGDMETKAVMGLMKMMADKDTARFVVMAMNGELDEETVDEEKTVISMRGHYMKPTFMKGDELLVTPKEKYERGDIVAFQWEDNRWHVSRVIALGGEKVYVEGDYGMVWVNGKMLEEPYLVASAWGAQIGTDGVLTVPEDCVFLMGDNRRLLVEADAPERGVIARSLLEGTVEEYTETD